MTDRDAEFREAELRALARLGARAELFDIEARLARLYELFPDEFAGRPQPFRPPYPLTPDGSTTTAAGNGKGRAPRSGTAWERLAAYLSAYAEGASMRDAAEALGLTTAHLYNAIANHRSEVRKVAPGVYRLKKLT